MNGKYGFLCKQMGCASHQRLLTRATVMGLSHQHQRLLCFFGQATNGLLFKSNQGKKWTWSLAIHIVQRRSNKLVGYLANVSVQSGSGIRIHLRKKKDVPMFGGNKVVCWCFFLKKKFFVAVKNKEGSTCPLSAMDTTFTRWLIFPAGVLENMGCKPQLPRTVHACPSCANFLLPFPATSFSQLCFNVEVKSFESRATEKPLKVTSAQGSQNWTVTLTGFALASCVLHSSSSECLDACLNVLARALEKNKENSEIWCHYLKLFSKRGTREEVQEMCETAVEYAPTYTIWWTVSWPLETWHGQKSSPSVVAFYLCRIHSASWHAKSRVIIEEELLAELLDVHFEFLLAFIGLAVPW